jgi:hypothetical protein
MDLSTLTTREWITIIVLLLILNCLVLGAFVWLIGWGDLEPDTSFITGLVLAEAPPPIPTRTPYPTFTPTPTHTSTPLPTYTPTPTPKATLAPTNTPKPTATRKPKPRPPTAIPLPTDTPTPAVDFRVVSVRRLTACENHGMHHIFINVYDKDGKGIPGIRLRVSWLTDSVIAETGHKLDVHPGYVEFAMFKGSYTVEVLDGTSEVAGPVSPDIPESEGCTETGNPIGNSLYHYSFEVIFQKTH